MKLGKETVGLFALGSHLLLGKFQLSHQRGLLLCMLPPYFNICSPISLHSGSRHSVCLPTATPHSPFQGSAEFTGPATRPYLLRLDLLYSPKCSLHTQDTNTITDPFKAVLLSLAAAFSFLLLEKEAHIPEFSLSPASK